MAPMPLTGTIGATTSANAELQAASNRKALPESVTSFFLPSIERPEKVLERKKQAALQKQQKKKEQRSRRSVSNRQKDVEEVSESEQEEEDLLGLDESMILLQSLRQSRLTHLTSMLPYLSTRHRTSTRYHPPPKEYPYPGGLDPSVVPPTLLNMGKADIRVGPFVFPRTRFSEARVEGGAQDAQGLSLMKGQTSDIATPAKVKKPRKSKTPKAAIEGGITTSNSPASAATVQTPAGDSTPIKPPTTNSSTPLANTPSTSAVPMQSTPLTKPANQVSAPPSAASASSSAVAQPMTAPIDTPPRPPMTPAPGAAPINEKVVKAVSAAAQQDPALQNLLYVAANNKASPDQLRELAAFIAKVSAGLEKIESAQAEERKKEEEKQAKIAAKKAARAADAKARRAAKKAAALAEAEKVGESSANVGEEEALKSGEEESFDASVPRFLPPPDVNQPPPYPPIVVVEFRENPSARFILPLWRDAVVELRQDGDIRSIKVSMLLPGIGSSAALRASDDDVNVNSTKVKGAKSVGKKSKAPDNEEKKDEEEKDSVSPTNPPTDEQLRKAAPKGAETRLVTWSISGTSKDPLSDAIWQIFGRLTGSKTIRNGVEITEEENSTTQNSADNGNPTSKRLSEDVLASVIAKIHALPSSSRDDERIPKVRVRPEEIPKDLPDHLSDKFAPRIQILASRPIVRIKRGTGADGEDAEQQFEVLRNIQAGNTVVKRARIKADEDEGEDTTMGLDGGEDESMFSTGTGIFGDQPSKPKRKRHVAKYNPDGSLKLCQACGTNSTPMWRRGPAGKSTLCNACGAKWKVGRLVVPDIPPTAPPPDEVKESQKVIVTKPPTNGNKETESTLSKEGDDQADVSMQEAEQDKPSK
ncbi:hypothetical protein L7F22_052616 [Adiantum nelumboides]|nr:hypothetical protein [Adiantum nelumboides]